MYFKVYVHIDGAWHTIYGKFITQSAAMDEVRKWLRAGRLATIKKVTR